MKALVLAGGSGIRLRPFSYSMPKQLIPVANRPVIEHCLGTLRGAGITDIAMVIGENGRDIEAALGDGTGYGVRITYLPQDRPRGLAHCVLLAADLLGDDDFVMYLGDNVLVGDVAGVIDGFRDARPAAQLMLTKVADPREYGVAELDASGRVTGLQEKPAWPRSNLAVMGLYLFSPAIHEATRSISASARGELEITDAIQWLIDRDHRVLGAEFSGYWKDTGRVDDVLECNRMLLGQLERRVLGDVDAASRLEGAVVLEPGVRVERSHLVGPLIVGAGSEVCDSYVGPYTAVGRNCRLRSAGMENSILLDGASVHDLRGLAGSVIGRCADVRLADEAGSRRRLVIGDHTEVRVA